MRGAVKKLHDEWASMVMPKDADQAQRQEMERAFYVGFYAALSYQLTDVANLSDDEAEASLAGLYKECEDYFAILSKAGKDISAS